MSECRVRIIWCRVAAKWSNAVSVKGRPVVGRERVGVSEARYVQLPLKAKTKSLATGPERVTLVLTIRLW